MTCSEVLDIVDADGIIEMPEHRMLAARAHAEGCNGCKAAFVAAGLLAVQLPHVAETLVVPDLSGGVMRQIRADGNDAAPQPQAARPWQIVASWARAIPLTASVALAVTWYIQDGRLQELSLARLIAPQMTSPSWITVNAVTVLLLVAAGGSAWQTLMRRRDPLGG